MSARSRLGSAAPGLLLAALAGCSVGPNYHRPAPAAAPPAAYKEAGASVVSVPPPAPANGGSWSPANPSDNMLKGKWWEIYRDPGISALEEKIALSNQTLRAAAERYQQAREQVRIARADYYPQLSVGGSGTRTRQSERRPLYVPGSKSNYTDLILSGQASWEPDLWGRVRRSVEASAASAQASAADLANLDLSLHAELALDYFQLRGLDLEAQLLADTVKAYQRQLELTERRFHGGVATESDVMQARTVLESTRAQLLDVGVARAQFEHAIATLIGMNASEFSLPPAPLDLALPSIPAGVPSQLLERRPDIAAAERRAQAASAQIGLAISAYYPNIQLQGSGGFESAHGGTWIQGPSSLWSLGGSATELLFDAGRRRAITRQAREGFEAASSDYRQAVLGGFAEVEDNLAALRILEQEQQPQRAAVAAAERSLALSTNRYKGGVTSYLEVLTVETALLQNQRTEASLVTRQFTSSVTLIRALGGGWDTTQLPPP